jgi:hypothetical protein
MRQAVRFSEGISWVVDAAQTIVVDETRRQVYMLTGDDRAVWDWLVLGYAFTRIAQMLAAMHAVTLTQGETELAAMIRGWHTAGLLEIAEQTNG